MKFLDPQKKPCLYYGSAFVIGLSIAFFIDHCVHKAPNSEVLAPSANKSVTRAVPLAVYEAREAAKGNCPAAGDARTIEALNAALKACGVDVYQDCTSDGSKPVPAVCGKTAGAERAAAPH